MSRDPRILDSLKKVQNQNKKQLFGNRDKHREVLTRWRLVQLVKTDRARNVRLCMIQKAAASSLLARDQEFALSS